MPPGTEGSALPPPSSSHLHENKYVREIESLASLENLTRAILGAEKGAGGEGDDPLGGLAGIGDDEMRAITSILQSIGAGGGPGGAAGGVPDMAQLLQQLTGGDAAAGGGGGGGIPPGLLGMMPSPGMPPLPAR